MYRKKLLFNSYSSSGSLYTTTPMVDADFISSIPAGWEYSRASAANAITGGTLQSFTTNTPRFVDTPCTGLLLEPTSSNLIPNPRGEGSTPPTLPSGWASIGASQLTWTLVGTGTENGIPYTDVRVNGTYASNVTRLAFCPVTAFPLFVVGQTTRCSVSAFVKLVGGSITANVTAIQLGAQPYDASQVVLGSPSLTNIPFPPASSGTPLIQCRAGVTAVVANASCAYFRPIIAVVATAGAVDLTLRIGCPQFENNGSAGNDGQCNATAPMFPPAGTPGVATRAGDLLRIANFTSRPGFTFSQGSILVEAQVQSTIIQNQGRRAIAAAISDNTNNNVFGVAFIASATIPATMLIITAGVYQAIMGTVNPSPVPLGVLSRIMTTTNYIPSFKQLALNGTFGNSGYAGSNNGSVIPATATDLTLATPAWTQSGPLTLESCSRVVRKVYYWPRVATSEEMNVLTSR